MSDSKTNIENKHKVIKLIIFAKCNRLSWLNLNLILLKCAVLHTNVFLVNSTQLNIVIDRIQFNVAI